MTVSHMYKGGEYYSDEHMAIGLGAQSSSEVAMDKEQCRSMNSTRMMVGVWSGLGFRSGSGGGGLSFFGG